jgi:hypothetical protein
MSNTRVTPESRLSSRRWRLTQSWWLILPIVGIGLFTFAGFLYCAIRVRKPRWWGYAIIFSGLSACVWVFTSSGIGADAAGNFSDWAGGFTVAVWIAGIIFAILINRSFLRALADQAADAPWYSQQYSGATAPAGLAPPPIPRESASPPRPEQSSATLPADRDLRTTPGIPDVDTSSFYDGKWPASAQQPPAPSRPARPEEPPSNARPPQIRPPGPPAPAPLPPEVPQPVGVVDVNAASADAIGAATRINPQTAARIVAVRDQRGGFSDLDDLVLAARLQPHELVRLRGKVSFGQQSAEQRTEDKAEPPASPGTRGGRILDI